MKATPEVERRRSAKRYADALRKCAAYADIYAKRCAADPTAPMSFPNVAADSMRELARRLDREAHGDIAQHGAPEAA